MRLTVAAAGVALGFVGRVHAKPPVSHPPSHEVAVPARVVVVPAAPLPMLPGIARVRVEVASDRLLVVQEISLPRGDWQSGGASFYVAFGAPGTPVALDVRLVAVARGGLEARPDDAGEPLAVEPAVRRDPSAQVLLGPPQMSGVLIRVSEAQLRRAYGGSDLLVVRIRSVVLSPPASIPEGARDVVVRLGSAGGLPLTLGRVQLLSHEPHGRISRAEARLCGPEADPTPLAIAVLPKAVEARETPTSSIAPAMAVRRVSDDLCIRWWAESR